MSKHQQILTELGNHVASKSEFDFMNSYKGVPLVYKGEIQAVQDEAAIFKIQAPDSVCLTWDDTTHILDNRLLSGIKARVLDFDIQSGIAKLGEFDFTERSFGDRSMVRVEMEDPIPVQIRWEKNQIEATIVDISLTGLGVQVNLPEKQIPTQNTPVNLKFQILERQVEIPGKIVAVFEANGGYRIATHIEDTSPGYPHIAQFISRRRIDLRQEIQDKYDQAI
jgi:hypothetical protein